jgi:hypothetical protein
MAKQREMQPRGEFDAELAGRVKEIFERNKPADMDPKTAEESKQRFTSMNASAMGVVHVSMGLTPEQSAELRKVESQRLRSAVLKTFLKRMNLGHDHSELIHLDLLRRYFETVAEQAARYGNKLDADIPEGLPKPSASLGALAGGYIKILKEGDKGMVLASPGLPAFVAFADDLNHLNAEDVLGGKTDEYMRRLNAANAAIKVIIKGALKAKSGEDLDTDTFITKVGERPPESERTTVSWRRVITSHPPEEGLTFSALDREASLLDPSVFPAFSDLQAAGGSDVVEVRRNLLGQLRWARTALQPYQRGDRMVDAVFSQGPVAGNEGLFHSAYFRLHPEGVVEKALDVVGRQQVQLANVGVMSTLFAVLDRDDRLTFGSHCRVSPARPAK